MRIRSTFSYYGGKSKVIDFYPAPAFPLIIEPFAGAAAYAWKWRQGRNVWVNDLDQRTATIWDFLTSDEALDLVRHHVPPTVEPGVKVSDLVPGNVPVGLLELMRAEANQGTQGARGVHDQVTPMGAKCWPRLRQKMEEVIPAVAHWHATWTPYDYLPNFEATWFIDPPYSGVAGGRYRTGGFLDYEYLAEWCKGRRGQVIVCENVGASWLPFQPLGDHRRQSIRSRYQRADAKEAIYVQHTVAAGTTNVTGNATIELETPGA